MSIAARFVVDRGAFVLDVDLEIPGQGVTALFGRSGSGKTTLLRCLAGLERVPGARLTVNGETWQSDDRFLPVHARPLGYVFQESSLFPHLTVRRNLHYGMNRVPKSARRVAFDETVQLLGLEDLLDRYSDGLSGGQRQRVAIGRALLTSPRLLLMDEPMASLDATSKNEIMPYLERLHDDLSIPVFYVSHTLAEVARLADHMVLLDDGKVQATGPLRELMTRPDLPLAHGESASAVLEAIVVHHHDAHHLTELSCAGGKLFVSREDLPESRQVRVSISARDVALNLHPPQDTSVLNCLQAKVIDLVDDPYPGHVLVRLDLGGQTLLSRVTRRSVEQLSLRPGLAVFALVKGAAIT